MIRRDDDEMNRAGHIYSPEESDGKTDWPTVIVTIGLTVIIAAIVIALLAFAALPAEARSWYDLHCCSDKDCAPAAAGTVTWTPAGWSVSATHEVVPFDDPRIRYTPPGAPQFHICKLPNANVLRCLYLPEPEG